MLQGVSARAAGGIAATRSTAAASPMPLPRCISPRGAYHSAVSRGSAPTRKAGPGVRVGQWATGALRQSSGPGGGQAEIVAAIERFRAANRPRRLDAAHRSPRTGARSVPAPTRLRRVEAHRDAPAPPADHRRRVRHVPLCDQLDAVRPAAGRPALPARRGRPLRPPHPPAAGRGGGARPAEPPPPPADLSPVGGQGRDAEPPRRVPARALPLRRRARAARARARARSIELQEGRCFYCAARLASRAGQTPDVDHFIPWSRYPDDGLENLVVAHARCNAQKRDFLAAAAHVRHWRARTRSGSPRVRALRTPRTAWTPRLSYGPTRSSHSPRQPGVSPLLGGGAQPWSGSTVDLGRDRAQRADHSSTMVERATFSTDQGRSA